MTSSWRADLKVPTLKTSINLEPHRLDLGGDGCPDADGDGFVDAQICGDLVDIEKVDCNDNDINVTPATERYIRQGRFLMGSSSTHAGSDEAPVHAVFLSGYCLDTNEVSVKDFAQWLNSSQRKPEGKDVRSLVISGTTILVESGRDNHPAEGVTWTEAKTYCEAKGQRLPTEAQWEKAARGGCEFGSDVHNCDQEDLTYPWGDFTPTCGWQTVVSETQIVYRTLFADAL